MDTTGLSSSLSLAAFLLVFVYLSLVEHSSTPGRAVERPNLFLPPLRTLRLASAVAVSLSSLALLASQGKPGVWLISVVALALIAFLVIADKATQILTTRYANTLLWKALPLKLFRSPSVPGSSSETEDNGKGTSRNGAEPLEEATVVITEEGQATLDARERYMIRSILRLDESVAREIMVPRMDIVAVETSSQLTEVAHRMLEWGHSRVPVYSETIDNVIGVVYARDLLPFLGKTREYPLLEELVRPAFFIPESKRLDELLLELQEKRIQMALVIDEYGGVEGLVTMEDLIEEIVGEIEDEFSQIREPRVVPLANGDIIVDARVTLDYLSDLLSTQLEMEDVDTVGGLVYSALGKMPEVGDTVTHNGLQIEVVSLLGRRLRKLRVQRTEPTKAS